MFSTGTSNPIVLDTFKINPPRCAQPSMRWITSWRQSSGVPKGRVRCISGRASITVGIRSGSWWDMVVSNRSLCVKAPLTFFKMHYVSENNSELADISSKTKYLRSYVFDNLIFQIYDILVYLCCKSSYLRCRVFFRIFSGQPGTGGHKSWQNGDYHAENAPQIQKKHKVCC